MSFSLAIDALLLCWVAFPDISIFNKLSATYLITAATALWNIELSRKDFFTGVKIQNMTYLMIKKCAPANPKQCERVCAMTKGCKTSFFNSSTGLCQFHKGVVDRREDDDVQNGLQCHFHDHDGCPETLVYKLDDVSSMCFKLYKTKKKWDEAEKQCVADGGHLIKLDTKEKINRFYSFYLASVTIAIGARKVNDQWKWVDGTEVADLWRRRQPSGDGPCVELRRKGFNDYNCRHPFQFVYELPLPSTGHD